MKTGKKLFIMAIAALMLVSVSTDVKASEGEERIVSGKSVENENAG